MRWLTWLKNLFHVKSLATVRSTEDFYTHECILCKRDPDASYCIPNPNKKAGK